MGMSMGDIVVVVVVVVVVVRKTMSL